ncbi:hypothetical protein P8935_16425 [Telmatobacter sp. DSM 110680]|uniref:DUF4136 domain-containing protein n=1 Tax=Telmatobacter sp. DSM 110680 TaxID=3036704 RepID=A0AAU7DES8_9BACT
MKFAKSIAILLTLVAPLALAKNKKKDILPAVFSSARFVYVQAEDGDTLKPGLFPEDRDAIANVQDALKDWNRYSLTMHRNDADLIIIVRRGRLAAAQLHGGVGAGTPTGIGASYPGRNPAGPGNPNPGGNPDRSDNVDAIGARGEAGPADDTLRVFSLTPQGKLSGPLWSREMKDGLDAPEVVLLRFLRDAVDHDYPPQPASPPAPTQKP